MRKLCAQKTQQRRGTPLLKNITTTVIMILISAGPAFWMTGCWDAREIDRRAFIFVMGIDLEEDGLYRVSAIAVRGGSQNSGAGAATSDGVSKAPLLTAQGRTVTEAMDALAGNSARSIDWGNLRSIILGEALSQKGVNEIVRTALADPRTPADVILFQARGLAEAIVSSGPAGEAHLQALLDHYRSKSSPETPAQYFVPAWQFRSNINNPGQDAYLGTIALREGAPPPELNRTEDTPQPRLSGIEDAPQGAPRPILGGIAAFKGDRLSGFLNEDQAAVFSWMSGKAGGLVVVSNPQVPDQPTTVRIISLRRGLTVSNNKSTILSINILAAGAINSTDNNAELASLTAAQMREQITATALLIQKKLAADLLGFGELARRSAPFEWWPAMWENQWNHAVWKVTVEVSLQAQGRYQ